MLSSANYWLAKETAKIVINLGCDMEVTSVSLTNTHHAHWGGFAAKKFRVKLRLWEDHKVWKSILNGTLDDPTGKVANSIALAGYRLLKVYKHLQKKDQNQTTF